MALWGGPRSLTGAGESVAVPGGATGIPGWMPLGPQGGLPLESQGPYKGSHGDPWETSEDSMEALGEAMAAQKKIVGPGDPRARRGTRGLPMGDPGLPDS